MTDLANQLLREEEGGSSSHVYLVGGLAHIARGTCIDPKVACDGLCQAALEAQDAWTLEQATQRAALLPGYHQCNDVRQAVLVSLAFQCGTLEDWPDLRAALGRGDYFGAAEAMLDSKAAKETPARMRRQAEMLKYGIWIEKGSDFGD